MTLSDIISVYTESKALTGFPIDEILEEVRDNTHGVKELLNDGSLKTVAECHVLMLMN
jgi:hypothetical protein